VVTYWTHTHVDMVLNPGQVILFFVLCSNHFVLLHYTKNYYTKMFNFLKIYDYTSLYGTVMCGIIVNSTSQICLSAMFLLPIVGNWSKIKGSSLWHIFRTKFHPVPSSSSWIESCGQTDGQTWLALYALISCKEYIIHKRIHCLSYMRKISHAMCICYREISYENSYTNLDHYS
jgi:hypothetical protein